MARENTENRKSRLEELYDLGKKKGVLTSREVMDHLTEAEMEPDQLDKILETLDAYGISVVNDESDIPVMQENSAENADVAAAEAAAAAEKDIPLEEQLDLSVPEGIAIDDPVRMYLRRSARCLC